MIVAGKLLLDPHAPPETGWLRLDPDRGVIEGVHLGEPPAGVRVDAGGRDALVIPAFIDAHFHFPQVDAVGCDGMELLEWLERIIFPVESWWGQGAARHMATVGARRLVRQGTLAVAGYLTSHGVPAREAATTLAHSTPLRLMLGRVAMDRNAPDDLIAEDLARGKRNPIPSPLLAPFSERDGDRVSANPRFAITCTEELLAEIGWLARERDGLAVQTHLAETRAECDRVRELFPDAADYASVYDDLGLLNANTLLAHCIHLAPDEWSLIAERRSVAVHCPTANLFLQAGLFDLDAARLHGVRLALGSDIAAGPDVAMPRVARGMIEVAKVRAMMLAGSGPSDSAGVHIPTPAEAFDLITRGNADAIGWHDLGRIRPDACANLLVLNVPATWHDEHIIGRLMYGWSSSLISSRIARGRLIDADTLHEC